ncbi:SecY-interacting protein Syd [Oceanisphaera avium]|uniref:SecY interacting protein Syd n=1 Tax=Oceanisphaera avium TaxID=1903694 RepID=A0A1Y0CWD2_9GAMM|nr:SecY-interacting protein Syd [Oceanisphaera avium]ART79641.1 SecY interacting protein Syd [Oceanisphaera avium]
MQDQVVSALSELFARQRRIIGIPLIAYDAEDPSPATLLPALNGQVGWQAWRKPQASSFLNVGEALELAVHEDVSAFFGHYFAGNIDGCFKGLFFTLLQPWNEQDFDRLQQNQIGHQLMMEKLKLPASWFLASCRDEQKLITLDNASGAVQLERLGKGSVGILAPSLAAFLEQVEPC